MNFPDGWKESQGNSAPTAGRYKDMQNIARSVQNQEPELPGYTSAEGYFDYDKAQRNNEKNIVQRVINKVETDNRALSEEYEQNRTHLRESEEYWNVVQGYKMNMQAHADDAIWNPYYWLYELPPMIGSSTSSPAQAASTVIKGLSTVAGVGLAPFTNGASLNLLWVSELATTPLDWQGAIDENYAEVGEKRIDNIINLLKDSDVTKDLSEDQLATYNEVMKELKARSEAVWRAKGWKESWIKEHLEGE
jgi:hypothetical protein